jgi:hypothetical protein
MVGSASRDGAATRGMPTQLGAAARRSGQIRERNPTGLTHAERTAAGMREIEAVELVGRRAPRGGGSL